VENLQQGIFSHPTSKINNHCCPVKQLSPKQFSYFFLLLFSEAKKVGKNAFPLIAAFKQPSVPDRSPERRGQDPERQALSGIGNLNGRLFGAQ
jgi:hypothetical protein